MKKQIFVMAFITLYSLGIEAQTLEWVKSLSGTNLCIGKAIGLDTLGNVYTTGDFTGTVDFNPNSDVYNMASEGGFDVFMLKLDPSGNYIYSKTFGGLNEDMATSINISGNAYISGIFTDSVDFNFDSGTQNLSSNGYFDIFITKIDLSGNFVWAKSVGGSTYDYISSITVDALGNLYCTGYYGSAVDFDPGPDTNYLYSSSSWHDMFVLKLDSQGNYLWVKSISGNSWQEGNSIAVDNSGNVYTTGYYYSTLDFDPGPGTYNLTSNGFKDFFISKLDPSGNFVWAKSIGGNLNDIGCAIKVDSSDNIYILGSFEGNVDFDTGPDAYILSSADYSDIFLLKLDSSGNFVFAKSFGGNLNDFGNDLALDLSSNIYFTGSFTEIADFDPGSGTFYLSSNGQNDIFVCKLDSSGKFLWATSMGAVSEDIGNSVVVDADNNVYVTGFYNETVDFDSGSGTYILNSTGTTSAFILKLKQSGISGIIFNDISQNCVRDSNEMGLPNRFVTIEPGGIVVQTNSSGVWAVDYLSAGTYTATADTSGNWSATCPASQIITVINSNDLTFAPDFGFVSTQPCPSPQISINMPFMRPCFSNQYIYVSACNLHTATGVLNNAWADIALDSLIIPQSSSIPYTYMGNYVYRFQLGNLYPGQCVYFTINCSLSCNAIAGQTLCLQANLFPADSCVFDTIVNPFPGGFTPCTLPWDHSSLSVTGYCQNDSMYFVVTNTGNPGDGDMNCYSPVRIYIDGVLVTLDSIMLAGGTSVTYTFEGDGRTWRLETDQHPLHPGNSHPNATIEACGDSTNWTPGLVIILPQDDSDPFVDIYCGTVTASYDPNDKTGYPTGITTEHYVMPNQQLQYVIRFQNTGNDTAFTVVIRDTLDINLDIYSVVQGAASHDYNFQIFGPRVLEWTFSNILLPDSNHNEMLSHGFTSFTVNQNPNLPDNTKIYNSGDIYFDFNPPVITNKTMHTVNRNVQVNTSENQMAEGLNDIHIYPNPFNSEIYIVSQADLTGEKFFISDVYGKKIKSGRLTGKVTTLVTGNLEKGIYLLTVRSTKQKTYKLIKY